MTWQSPLKMAILTKMANLVKMSNIAKVHRRHPLKSGNFGEYGENDEFDVERAPLIVVILTKIANLAKILP